MRRDPVGLLKIGDAQNLREAEQADERRYELNAAQKVRVSERQAVVARDRLDPDHRQAEAQPARDPALQDGIALPREAARDQDAPDREQELLPGAEIEREDEQDRRQRHQHENADQIADEGAGDGHAERFAAPALFRDRVARELRGHGVRRAGNVQQDGADRAAERGARVDPHQERRRVDHGHGVGELRQQRHAHGHREARHGAPDDAQAGAQARIQDRMGRERIEKAEHGAGAFQTARQRMAGRPAIGSSIARPGCRSRAAGSRAGE
ncbi:MAG: hypothetical protein MI824_01735 [Hyphomicrobiales bacterium]|nr:hypothetical protein [Hyphomicrobiales bacterium]